MSECTLNLENIPQKLCHVFDSIISTKNSKQTKNWRKKSNE